MRLSGVLAAWRRWWARRHRSVTPPTREQREAALLRAQTGATVVGVVVSVLALLVSAVAWRSQAGINDQQRDINVQQRRMNEQQLELNRRAATREDRIYASRVAVWATVGRQDSSLQPAGLDVSVQNRSPVPLYDVRVSALIGANRALAETPIDNLPPCTVARFRLAPLPGDQFSRTERQYLGYTALRLAFTETGRGWLLDGSRLEGPIPPAPSTAPRELRVAAMQPPESVGDCGEAT
jgi:type II secretory pathway pseudopilin PulG